MAEAQAKGPRPSSRVGALLVGAGQSHRMRGVDKVFVPLLGQPLVAHVLEVFQSCPAIDEIVLVLGRQNLAKGRRLLAARSWPKKVTLCLGGARRQDSVRQGLKKLKPCGWVVIHDVARPCVTPELIERGLALAQAEGAAAAAAIPVTDTIKLVGPGERVKETLPRQNLWAAQTPQVFRFDIINEAHRLIQEKVTDDAALVEKAGHSVRVYLGSYDNIKVTTPEDLLQAELILARRREEKPRAKEGR